MEEGDKIKVLAQGGPNFIPKTDFFPLKTNLFEGIPVSIPNRLDTVLNNRYGDDWEEICTSSGYNHRKERSQRAGHTVSCKKVTSTILPTDEGIFDNVWVVNLDRRPERWRSTQNRLRQLDLHPRRWSATDKNDPNFGMEYERLNPSIRKGQFACYLSHLKLWRFLYQSGVPYAIIFEDDIFVPPSVTKDLVAKTVNSSKGFDIILLGHCSRFQVQRGFETLSHVGGATCTHAYAVSREGLRKLVEHNHNYKVAVDLYMHYDYCSKNMCYYAKDMGQESRGGKIWAKGLFSQDDSFPTDVQ